MRYQPASSAFQESQSPYYDCVNTQSIGYPTILPVERRSSLSSYGVTLTDVHNMSPGLGRKPPLQRKQAVGKFTIYMTFSSTLSPGRAVSHQNALSTISSNNPSGRSLPISSAKSATDSLPCSRNLCLPSRQIILPGVHYQPFLQNQQWTFCPAGF